VRALAVTLLALAAGCLSAEPSGPCVRDGDCAAGVCARTRECAAADDLVEVAITWTIDGAAPSPTAPAPCDGIDSLTVSLIERDGPGGASYSPVGCQLGQIRFDRIPVWVDAATVEAFDADGRRVATASAALDGPAGPTREVAVDLR
jgi:hypothetical protein